MTKFFLILTTAILVTGCATVPLADKHEDQAAKEFRSPSEGMAGIYVYRSAGMGTALKKDIWIDGECLGRSAPETYFYTEVIGGMQHTVSTESEFSPNDLVIDTEEGSNYFVEQYLKPGVFIGGADLQAVSADKGQSDIAKIHLARLGMCANAR